ncbi:MAG: cytochrome b N-terminal domain-containing protein, partial [Nitrospinae bacterium]|nr:cytochrome b N-terminal domain-containing protein [Nitrospinota bacterium]
MRPPLAPLERGLERLLTPSVSPAPAAGQTTLFLLTVMLVTGIYLFFFYAVDWPGAWRSVADMGAGFGPGALLRGIHRHGADLLLLAALWHLLRTIVTSRGEAGYRTAWLTGMGLLLFFTAQGVTGYLLPLDIRGEAILRRLLATFPFPDAFAASFAANDTVDASALVYLVALHLIPPLAGAMLLGAHLARKGQRPRLWPSRWLMASLVAGLAVAALVAPATSLPQAAFDRFPKPVPADFLFLWPVGLMERPALFWGSLLLLLAAAVGAPFLLRRPVKPLVAVDAPLCVGCRLCHEDCPKQAITMRPRPPEERHPWIAVIDPALCAGCATCVGSCGFDALSMPNRPTDAIRADRAGAAGKTILYGCVTACGGTNPLADDPSVLFVPLLCAGQLSPAWVTADFAAGAVRVVVARCSELRCEGRDGARFVEERLSHRRRPWPPKRKGLGRLTLVDMAPGQTAALRRALTLPPTEEGVETVRAAGTGRRVAGALLLATTVALVSVGLDRLWLSNRLALGERQAIWGALRVEGFKPVTATFAADGAKVAAFELAPPQPLAPLLAYRLFRLPHRFGSVTATLAEQGEEAVTARWEGGARAGAILLFRFDAARGGLTPPPV